MELVKVTWIIALPLNIERISLNLEYLNFPSLQTGNNLICEIKFDDVAHEYFIPLKYCCLLFFDKLRFVSYVRLDHIIAEPNWAIIWSCEAELMRIVGFGKQKGSDIYK